MTEPIIHRFDPRNIDVSKCDHEADPPVCYCIHDWRIGPWQNAERTGDA